MANYHLEIPSDYLPYNSGVKMNLVIVPYEDVDDTSKVPVIYLNKDLVLAVAKAGSVQTKIVIIVNHIDNENKVRIPILKVH